MTQPLLFPLPKLAANSLSISNPLLPTPQRPLPSPSLASRSTVTMSTSINDNVQDQLDAIFKQKKVVRSQVRKTLKAMDPSLRSHEDIAVQDLVLGAPWFKSCQRLCAYISCKALREVDTSKLLSEILENPAKDGHMELRKKLYVPRVEDKNSHMRMLNISRIDDLIANSMDILEPASVDSDGNEREDVMQANDPVDLFILPGLAFDRTGRRLGRGGGYYDTFIRNYQELAKTKNWKQPFLVALSYSSQIMNEGVIPMTENDIPVDALVSPSGVIPISSAALDRENPKEAMVSLSSSGYYLLFCLLGLLLTHLPSHSADPDPLQDFCVANLNATFSINGYPCKSVSETTSEDFFFSGLSKEGDTNSNPFGFIVTAGNVKTFPGLNTLGLSMNRVDYAPGGLNPPHSHPRATETGVVIKGKLLVGFITTDNVFYSKVLTVGEMFVIPRGLVHFQRNVGEGKAMSITAFNSQLPGAVVIPTNLFATTPPIPNQVLTKAFQVGDDVVNSIKSKFGG
ncbi:hypothetical protein CsatA_001909 [Cannabis sativa]